MADDIVESGTNSSMNNTNSNNTNTTKPVYQNKMVRTDARSQTLHSFMSPANTANNNTNQMSSKLPLAGASMDVDEDFDTANKKQGKKRPREDDEASSDLTYNDNNREDNDHTMA